ncbi:MAG: hypothetical protein KC549_18585 [Myxococcales bacterium]|nr:hypothetical protein [Myxococcales bacterium]MCB9546764.1 hypothetical protein [Myxococcales bacterium]
MAMFSKQMNDAAEKVAYGFITRRLDPSLREPVENFLAQGWGVSEFGESCISLVREGWFGDRRVQLRVNDDGDCTIHRL